MVITKGLDLDAFAEFFDLMGASRGQLWLDAFLQRLNDLFVDSLPDIPDRESLFQRTHSIVGSAGIVGCVDLVDVCIRLQDACQSGQEIAALYLAAQKAARQADIAVRFADCRLGLNV